MSLESLDRAVKGTIDLSVGDIIAKYGTTPAIAMAVQRGEIKNVTNAVMAGMAIDRIAKSAMKPPEMTVAQEVFAQSQPAPQTGVAAAQQMQGQPAGAGLDQIPISEGMFTAANGGIVAFEDGGSTMFTGTPLGPDVRGLAQVSPRIPNFFSPSAIFFDYMTDEEKEKYQTTGVVPEAAKKRYQNSANTQGAQAQLNENIIAQAQRGEGPNVSRPAAPADAAVVPPGGPVIPRPTGVKAVAAPTSVVKKPEEKKPVSIFDEASNAANKLQAYKTQFGVGGDDPDAAMRDKLKQLQEGSKEERREAAYMAMIMAGLGIAGGTSPYAAVNLKEAIPALKEYGVAKRDIKKADMEYTKMETEINRAAEARKRGDMELALKLEESAADRDLKLRQVVAAERAASRPSQLGELINLATKGTAEERALARGALKDKSGDMNAYQRATLQQKAMKNATDEIRNNRQISRLANSKDPKDKAEAERLRNEITARHMGAISSGSNLGGATLLSYGDE